MAKKPQPEEAVAENPRENTTPMPANRAIKPGMVKVRAKRYLAEDGKHRQPGEVFETTPERAKALASLVDPV